MSNVLPTVMLLTVAVISAWGNPGWSDDAGDLLNDYLQREESMSITDAIINGSMERLVPILMTALTAALALVPIVLKGDQPGNEILAPLSIVILGGLLSSTFLNLIVVPAGYAIIRNAKLASSPQTKEQDT